MKPVLGTDPNFLETLVEINHDITSTLDLDQLLRKIAAFTNRIIPYQIFAIFLVDEAKRDLYYRFGIGHAAIVHINNRARNRSSSSGLPQSRSC